jgi:hypothetical protein
MAWQLNFLLDVSSWQKEIGVLDVLPNSGLGSAGSGGL